MTNHWIDIGNSDCILIMGSNAAENHPISFKWVERARLNNGAKLLSVDPRFTRTSARADFYAALRSGTDIAFLGGMMNYILTNDKYFQEYVANYTNASFILKPSYYFKDGLFSGYNPKTRSYNKKTWGFETNAAGIPKRDLTLKNPRSVFQQLKKHYSRYTLDKVSAVTGTPKSDLQTVYETYAATGKRGMAGTIMYAMGWTQHTVGVQNIRAMAMIQLLLGNMGVAGGGVNALRGESNVQGSTDHCLLWHIWPGYLKTPRASNVSLAAYNKKWTPVTHDPLSANWWGNYPKYSVSFLKAMFGKAATKKNDFGYDWMPKVDNGVSYSWLDLFDEMYKGKFKGFFAWGQNPACSGANANKNRAAFAKLDWMVNVNLFPNETGAFWKGPGMDPKKIKTEVFLLPCASSMEKEGSITNSGRWSQWRYKAVNPPGQARPDGDIMVELWKRIVRRYKRGGKFRQPILHFRTDWMKRGRYDAHGIAKLINGYFEKDTVIKGKTYKKGTLVPSFAFLKADGSTSSGNWLYCNSYTQKGNMAARRGKKDPSGIGLYSQWSWCWPVNRRIIYNRASVDLKGQPWDTRHPVIRFAGKAVGGKYVTKKWVGDVPDGGWYPMENPDGSPRKDTRYPFIMKPSGFAHIFGPGRADGPFPEHYEPLECPVKKNLFSSQLINPTVKLYASNLDILRSCDPEYPFVATTYRITEHWQTGVLTRWQPWLLEAEPQQFCEMSHQLAKLRGINNGDKVIVRSPRGQVEAVAMVTNRFRPFTIEGNEIHEIGLPWCYGWRHPKDGGDSSNLLTPSVGDPNTRIPETKAFMVNVVRKGR